MNERVQVVLHEKKRQRVVASSTQLSIRRELTVSIKSSTAA